jgi:hypothetical protein
MNKRARALFTLNPSPFRRSIDLIENRSCDRVVVVVVVVVVSRATKPPRAGCVSSSLVDETRARRVNLKKKRQSNQSNRGEEKRARSLDPFSRIRVSVRVSVVGFALARARPHASSSSISSISSSSHVRHNAGASRGTRDAAFRLELDRRRRQGGAHARRFLHRSPERRGRGRRSAGSHGGRRRSERDSSRRRRAEHAVRAS